MTISETHFTALPPGFIIVRILQLLFAAVTFSLSIFMVIEFGTIPQYVVVITSAVTFIPLIWITVASYIYPRLYNYWAVLVMEILLFGICLTCLIFSLGSGFNAGERGCLYEYNKSTQTWELHCKTITNESLFHAASLCGFPLIGFAGGLMVLSIVSLIVVSVFIARHRRAGGHCKQGSEALAVSEE